MIHYSRYAENKFAILNKFKVFIRREQIEEAVRLPDAWEDKGCLRSVCKDKIKVIYRPEGETARIITFFPIK